MISKVGPLVKAGERRQFLGLHVLGGITGGALVGVLLGTIGLSLDLLGSGSLSRSAAIVVPAALVGGALLDLRVVRLPHLSTSRQTPGYWPCALGHGPASFAWGFDLGLGVTTRTPHQALWGLLIAALLLGDPLLGALIMGAYGVARAIAVAGAVLIPGGSELANTCDIIVEHRRTATRLVASASLVVGFVGVLGLVGLA